MKTQLHHPSRQRNHRARPGRHRAHQPGPQADRHAARRPAPAASPTGPTPSPPSPPRAARPDAPDPSTPPGPATDCRPPAPGSAPAAAGGASTRSARASGPPTHAVAERSGPSAGTHRGGSCVVSSFDRLDHQVMVETLGEKIHDNRLLRLVSQMLAAGYLEDWVWNATLSGAPQGGVLSPCLSNIYLNRLDTFVETVLMPEYTRGVRRTPNPEHRRITNGIYRARKRGDHATVRALRKQQRSLPVLDPSDPGYRRLRYTRYADDILLGFTGPKTEAEEIKRRLAQFLQDELRLELSKEKTLITHARTSAARFLGYEITIQHDDRKITAGRRSVNGRIRLRVPMDVIKAKCARYMQRGKPERRPELMNESDHAIISRYAAEYRGIVQYYLLAGDVYRLSRLHWVMLTSLLKTLAGKHDSTVTKMARVLS